MNIIDQYNHNVDSVVKQIRDTQQDKIMDAASIISETIERDGIVQAFGSGHSFAGAIEVAGRAGGFIQTKAISHFYGPNGWFETIPGVGDAYANLMDIEENDCFIIISNSGKNPLHVEMAKHMTSKGNKLIVICNLHDATNNAKNGSSILDYADVVIDNCGYTGDCSIEVEEFNIAVAPTSSIAVAHITSMVMLNAMQQLIDRGITPPIYKSANIEGGREYNHHLREKYKHRLLRLL